MNSDCDSMGFFIQIKPGFYTFIHIIACKDREMLMLITYFTLSEHDAN